MSTITAATTPVPTGTWNVDPSHSRVEFQVKHLGIATVRGHFAEFEGTLEVGEDLDAATARGLVKVDSVNTNEDEARRPPALRRLLRRRAERAHHVRVEAHRPGGRGHLRDHGRPHAPRRYPRDHAEGRGHGTEEDPWGNERVGLEVTGQLNRGDYGMTFNQALGSGNMLVSDRVKLALDISAVKQA